jgi:hypothetical protein
MIAGTVLLAAVAAAAPQEAPRPPAPRDTDQVELDVEQLGPWLERFGAWISTGEDAPFRPGAALVSAPASAISSVSVGTHRIERFGTGEGVPMDSAALRASLLGDVDVTDEIEVHAKVVAVRQHPITPEFEIRVEAAGGDWQVVARVQARLARQAVADVHPDPTRASVHFGPWECRALTISEWERVSSEAPPFVERSAGIFANAPDAARVLGVGMDRWAQRLDDPALSAWFGHQGLAAGDVNGDGREDLYVAMPSGLPNMLLLQQEDGSVRDVAPERGVAWLDDTKGVLLVDVDADGRLDVVSALGHVLVVQRGVGDGAFPIAGWCVAPDEAPFYGISAADVDGDGDLDLFGARYVTTRYADTVPVPFEDARNGPSNHLFRNDAGRFVDVSAEMGLAERGGRFSLQGVFTDFDLDGDPDLHVVNDFGRNQMFVLEDGKYVDRAAELGLEDQGAGMGASWSDFDQDGDLDVYVSNMFSSAGRRVAFQSTFGEGRTQEELAGIRRLSLGNSLFVRDGDAFADRSDDAGVRMGRWAWGAAFCDLNGDGYDDIVSPSGFLTGPKPGDL